MFENPRRSRQTRNFTTNVPQILDLKSSSEQIFFRKLSLGAPDVIKGLLRIKCFSPCTTTKLRRIEISKKGLSDLSFK